MNARHIINLLISGILCASCQPVPAGGEDDHDHGPDGHSHDESAEGSEEGEPHDDHGIELSETARRNLGISFVRLKERRVSSMLRVPGAFELRPLARHEYHMSLPGRVELLVDQYQRVEAGDLLYRFQSPKWPELLHEILTGEQAIASATAQIAVAESMVSETRSKLVIARERIAALASADFKRADLQAELQALEAELPRRQAELRAAHAKLENAHSTHEHAMHVAASAAEISEEDLERKVEVDGVSVPAYRTIDWVEVHARTGGVIEHLDVTDGTFIDATEPVLSVVDPGMVRFRALAMQSDLGILAEVDRAEITPPYGVGESLGPGVAAQVMIGLDAHPRERTLELLAIPDEAAPWIRPGVSAFLEIVTDQNQAAELAVPDSSIVRDGLSHLIYLREKDDPDHVHAVEVELGVSDGRWTVVKSADAEFVKGAEVVFEGAYELKLAGDTAGPGAPTHVHADGTTH